MNVVILYSNCCEYKSISEVRDIIQENYSSYCGSECAASYSDLEQLLRDCLSIVSGADHLDFNIIKQNRPPFLYTCYLSGTQRSLH
ncbi:MAG: hypothetical protein HAW67_04420 [Endozoicomonadaceae bacterium]|nr:hypothetical protein [Endozoicomonadaceae bacterium]